MTYALRRRRLLAQEESIRLGATQLPEIHSVLVRHCLRAGIPVPDLYLSDGVDHTTSFEWRGQNCTFYPRTTSTSSRARLRT